jgi:hypothetical protein
VTTGRFPEPTHLVEMKEELLTEVIQAIREDRE